MLKLINIEYELSEKNQGIWKAYILATNEKDAASFLKKTMKNLKKINSISNERDIHGITDPALDYIIKKSNRSTGKEIIKEVIKEVEVIKEIPVESTVKTYTCPWCEKPFESPQGLKIHISRTHSKDKEPEQV